MNETPGPAIDEILIGAAGGETRIALLAEGRLCELEVGRPGLQSTAGNIYLGRIEKVMPSIEAAFVEVGLARSGFLALAETRPLGARGDTIAEYVSEGDPVLVQVLRDPTGEKGAKLTARITLPGRYLVLAPSTAGPAEIKVSRRIAGEEARDRLTARLGELAAEGECFIARTAAAEAGAGDLAADAAALRAVWTEITEKRRAAKPPARLHADLDPARRVLRDATGPGVGRIVVDDAGVLAGLKGYCRDFAPDLVERLELHKGPGDLFDVHGIDAQIEAALSPTVGLPSGGSIIFGETAALTAIDVNTGGAPGARSKEDTALGTNLEAAAEIARQIRLRNLSGLLVADFVPMKRSQNVAKVLDALRGAVAGDPCTTHVIGTTRLGLVEMTRRKKRDSLINLVNAPCPACSGTGRAMSPESVAYQALRAALRAAAAAPHAGIVLRASPKVIEALDGPAAAALAAVGEKLGRAIRLRADETLSGDAFDVVPVTGNGQKEGGDGRLRG